MALRPGVFITVPGSPATPRRATSPGISPDALDATQRFMGGSDEALAAADAIDKVLQKKAEPVHQRLKESLTTTLRSRAKVARSLDEIDVAGVSKARGLRTGLLPEDMLGGSRSFGKQLAASWTSLPDTGLDGGRSRVLSKLDGTQAARVRGLLTHLEFAVQADPGVSAAKLLNVLEDEMPWYDGVAPQMFPSQNYGYDWGYESPGEEDHSESPVVATLPQEDPWPYERFKIEPRSRVSGMRFLYKINGTASQRLMSFLENLRMAYGGLGEAFASIDMDGRRCISFDHFHAHLVRLKLSRCDAEGSIRAAELFKLLDADGNDLITPNDVLRTFEAAARAIRAEVSKANHKLCWEDAAREHGYADGMDHVRYDKHLRLTGDDALRIATLRRFFELQDQTLMSGLKAMDDERSGFVRKEAFVCSLIEDGYCVSTSEAMDLFQVLDVHQAGSLSLRYLEMLDEGERLGASVEERRPPASPRAGTPGVQHLGGHMCGLHLRSGIGSGGLFSDPGRLDGPRPPPKLHGRMELLRKGEILRKGTHLRLEPDEDGPDIFTRLHTTPTVSCTNFYKGRKRASDVQVKMIDNLMGNLESFDEYRAGSSLSPTRSPFLVAQAGRKLLRGATEYEEETPPSAGVTSRRVVVRGVTEYEDMKLFGRQVYSTDVGSKAPEAAARSRPPKPRTDSGRLAGNIWQGGRAEPSPELDTGTISGTTKGEEAVDQTAEKTEEVSWLEKQGRTLSTFFGGAEEQDDDKPDEAADTRKKAAGARRAKRGVARGASGAISSPSEGFNTSELARQASKRRASRELKKTPGVWDPEAED